MSRRVMVDLFCGRGGWSKGFLSRGWHCIGIDVYLWGNRLPAILPHEDFVRKVFSVVSQKEWKDLVRIVGIEGARKRRLEVEKLLRKKPSEFAEIPFPLAAHIASFAEAM